MKSNMELWNKVCKTDPDHTKYVDVRGGFTAIDAMYQIQNATEQFGAAGEGWGWSFSDPVFPPNETVVVKCTLWHGKKENTVEQFGQKKLGKDEDALKKAGTDALTKCLSYLGFNADVFLGKFDDNKYVAEVKKEIKASKPLTKEERMQQSLRIITAIKNLKDLPALAEFLENKAVIHTRKKLDGKFASDIDEALSLKQASFREAIPSPSGLEQG